MIRDLVSLIGPMQFFRLLPVLAFVVNIAAQIIGGNRVLILSENDQKDSVNNLSNMLSSMSRYFHIFLIFVDDGFYVAMKNIDDGSATLSSYGEYIFDTVILVAPHMRTFIQPKSQFNDASTQGISDKQLADFVDAGGNLLIAVSQTASTPIRNLVNQFSMSLGPTVSPATLHFPNTKSVISLDSGFLQLKGFASILKSKTSTKVESILSIDGNSIVSAMQALNGARVSVIGSHEILSMRSQVANDFIVRLVRWTARRSHYIRVAKDQISHRLATSPRGTPQQRMYREGLELHAEFVMEVRNGDAWEPFFGPLETGSESGEKGIPVDFFLLDPYIRTVFPLDTQNATDPAKEALYSKTFKIPDKCGIFKFVVDFKPAGYNHLHLEQVLPIRNFRHDDFERFKLSALPYYMAELSTLILTLVFVFLFLWHKETGNQITLKNYSSNENVQNDVIVEQKIIQKYLPSEKITEIQKLETTQ